MNITNQELREGDQLIEKIHNSLSRMSGMLEILERDEDSLLWFDPPWIESPSDFIAYLDWEKDHILSFSDDLQFMNEQISINDKDHDLELEEIEKSALEKSSESGDAPDYGMPTHIFLSYRRKSLEPIMSKYSHESASYSSGFYYQEFQNGLLLDWDIKKELLTAYQNSAAHHDHDLPEALMDLNQIPAPLPSLFEQFVKSWEKERDNANSLITQLSALKNYPFKL